MGKNARSLKMNPALLLLVRRFIVVPSMLLVSVFCIWTFFSLVAFSFFSTSHHCSGQECTSLLVTRGFNQMGFSKLLNFEVEQHSAGEDGLERSIKSTQEATSDSDTVAALENMEDGVDQGEDSSLVQELRHLGFVENTRRSTQRTNNKKAMSRIVLRIGKIFTKQVVQKAAQVLRTSENGSLSEEDSQVIREGLRNIMEDLRRYSSIIPGLSNASCTGRWIYSYDLPPKFNEDLVALCDTILPWYSMCEYFDNHGMGRHVMTDFRGVLKPPGRWYVTNQYMLEVLFHAKLKQYECLTDDPTKAQLFHIPYYGGIDVSRYHYANVTYEKKDELGRELVTWLEEQPTWRRHYGHDHFLVLGKITWDFRRNDTDWGNTFLMFPEIQNVTRLLIEREPWNEHDVGVPHPTYFHPNSDSDMDLWLRTVRDSQRVHLFSFAGMPRTTDTIRSVLITICKENPKLCRFLECSGDTCFRPESTMSLFLSSHFCLQPVGDSATRRSVFDSLIGGCIPVLFSELTAYVQYPWHLPRRLSSYSVYISAEDVKAGNVDVAKLLAGISRKRRNQMRENILRDVIPRLVYAAPGANISRYEDAFDVSIRSLLEKSRPLYSSSVS